MSIVQYLSGCTQYFATASTNQKIPAGSKSKSHSSNGPLKDPILDDYQDFHQLDQALSRLGLSDSTKLEIYAMVAGVLHLGNISFEENPDDVRGGCQVSKSSEHTLSITSKLLGVDPFELRHALVSRVMQSKGGGIKGTVIMYVIVIVSLTVDELSVWQICSTLLFLISFDFKGSIENIRSK